jgi:hypothetical protein
MHEQYSQDRSLTGTSELGYDAVDLDFEGAEYAKADRGHPGDRITPFVTTLRGFYESSGPLCSRFAAGISLVAARAHDGVLVSRIQRPKPKELDVFRISLILGVFVALLCAGISAAADGSTGRPDGRFLPDGADIQRTTPARPDDRGDRFTPGASSEPAVVISANGGGTTSFDWLAALIGGLTVGGLALATGGLLVLRHRAPTPAR